MARRNRSTNPITVADILGVLLVCAFFLLLKHLPWLLFTIVAVIIGAIVIKRRKYLRWFYDRDRRIAELNADDYMDTALTEAILQAAAEGSAVAVGENNPALDKVKESYELLLESCDILHGDAELSSENTDRALIPENGIVAENEPMILRFIGENKGGYVFYVFPETILAFLEGPQQVVFLAAYSPAALSLSYKPGSHTLPPVVVEEKSQRPIEYYDRYCPVPDGHIISSRWEVTNKDGSRSFRGGLRPENNPLHFTLKYSQLVVEFGDYSVTTAFSRFDPAVFLTVAFNEFKAGTSPEP